ncbi:MAG: bifunctional oligoribonuclease/PAP phosphatase NrnA [Actinomycetota bacterium]
MIDEAAWDAAVSALSSATQVSLACHESPDADALGSMLAVALGLRARGVAVACGAFPLPLPQRYSFIPGLDLLKETLDRAPSLMVTFDAGSMDRMGPLASYAKRASSLIVVDHHITNDKFGTIDLVDPMAAASAVVARELLARLGIPIDKDIATCLYAGLVTDTGRFQYANTTPSVHTLAAELIACGVEHDKIAQQLFASHSIGFLKLASLALARVAIERGVVWSWVGQQDLETAGATLEEAGELIDLIRTVEDVDVAASLRQQGDGRWLVSMRSRGATDVGAICESLGGGGHRLAAGFRIAGEPAAIMERIVASQA